MEENINDILKARQDKLTTLVEAGNGWLLYEGNIDTSNLTTKGVAMFQMRVTGSTRMGSSDYLVLDGIEFTKLS